MHKTESKAEIFVRLEDCGTLSKMNLALQVCEERLGCHDRGRARISTPYRDRHH